MMNPIVYVETSVVSHLTAPTQPGSDDRGATTLDERMVGLRQPVVDDQDLLLLLKRPVAAMRPRRQLRLEALRGLATLPITPKLKRLRCG